MSMSKLLGEGCMFYLPFFQGDTKPKAIYTNSNIQWGCSFFPWVSAMLCAQVNSRAMANKNTRPDKGGYFY